MPAGDHKTDVRQFFQRQLLNLDIEYIMQYNKVEFIDIRTIIKYENWVTSKWNVVEW